MRLVVKGMPICAGSYSHGSSLAGGDRVILSGARRASEDCKMELAWVPVGPLWQQAARGGRQVCPLGLTDQKQLSIVHGRSCLGGRASLIPAWSRAGSHPKPSPQGDLFQPCLERCCSSQLRAQGNTEFGLIQHKSRSLLSFSFSLSWRQWGREKPTGSALSRGANHMQIAPLRWH